MEMVRRASGESTRRLPGLIPVAVAVMMSGAMSGCTLSAPEPPNSATGTGTELGNDYHQVVTGAVPWLVTISGEGVEPFYGICYDSDGHIVVIARLLEGVTELTVAPAIGSGSTEATVVAVDERENLAVLKVDSSADLVSAMSADPRTVTAGLPVLAMGNPLSGSGSITDGIIASIDYAADLPAEGGLPATRVTGLLATTTLIDRGNLGGALLNLSGQLVGMVAAAGASGDEPRLGLAVPAATVTRVADALISRGTDRTGPVADLGVTVRTVVNRTLVPTGVLVESVRRGGPAADARIHVGDVIVEIGEEAISDTASFRAALAGFEPEDKVMVTVERDGEEHAITVTVGSL